MRTMISKTKANPSSLHTSEPNTAAPVPRDEGTAVVAVDPPPAPIELETRTYTVVQLLDEVRRGRVRLPRFQRSFRWSDEDRRQLFDSLQHGYPVGTLLLARGQAPAGRVALAGFLQDVSAAPDVLWVVDGQQRLATLAMALVDDHSGGYRPIYFDISNDKFVLGIRRRAPPPEWIPARVLLSSAVLNRWLRGANLSDALSDRADQVAARLREYRIPAYLVPYDGQNDAMLQRIFARTNRSGHALERFEVFEALNLSVRGDEVGPIARIRANLMPLGFGDVAPQDIERVALAVSNATPTQHLDALLEAGSLSAQLSREVTEGLSRAIQFLREDAGIPHITLLPYSGALFTLARFFALHPAPHPRNRDLLTRWLWRGMLNRDHRTDNAIDGRKWRAITKDEHGSVQRLLRLLPPLTATEIPTELGTFRRGNNARSSIELVALADLEPLLLTGEDAGSLVPLAALLHEDPPEVLAPSFRLPNAERTLAEILLHPRMPPDLLRDQLCNAPAALLRSHGIGESAVAALQEGDLAKFVCLRGVRLAEHLVKFLRERVVLDPPDHDRAPLDAYFSVEDP